MGVSFEKIPDMYHYGGRLTTDLLLDCLIVAAYKFSFYRVNPVLYVSLSQKLDGNKFIIGILLSHIQEKNKCLFQERIPFIYLLNNIIKKRLSTGYSLLTALALMTKGITLNPSSLKKKTNNISSKKSFITTNLTITNSNDPSSAIIATTSTPLIHINPYAITNSSSIQVDPPSSQTNKSVDDSPEEGKWIKELSKTKKRFF